MKKGNDIKLTAYLIGYGIALLFLLLPYLADAGTNVNDRRPKKGYNYKKHYKKQAKNRRKNNKTCHWTGEGCGINR